MFSSSQTAYNMGATEGLIVGCVIGCIVGYVFGSFIKA